MLLIKVGGGKHIRWDYIAQDLVEIVKKQDVMLVHGANATRDEVAEQLGYKTKIITSPSGIESVYTDQKAIDIFLMSYAGLVNKNIVALLQKNELNAVGLTGIDGRLWEARQKKQLYIKDGNKEKMITGSLTGKVEKVNPKIVKILIENKFIPVICPPAISFEKEVVNTDNDWAVAMMIGELKIKYAISLFEAPGMLKDVNDEKSIVKEIKSTNLDEYLSYAKGRMKKKVLGVQKAFELGLEKMYWADGRVESPITKALNQEGTVIF